MHQLFYMEIFIDNIVYIVVFVTIMTFVFFFLNRGSRFSFMKHEMSKNQIEIRLRAYERLMLFLERVEPVGMINRLELHDQSIELTASLLIKNIVIEYEYNTSQQIYVSDRLWKSTEFIKNKIINNISNISKSIDKEATINDFVSQLLEQSKEHILIINQIKKALKKEVHALSKI